MVERKHRVGLAAAEISLKLHHRIAAFPRDALHSANEQSPETLSEECPAKELRGLAIFVRTLAEVHLPQIRCELRLLVPPARDVRVRCYHLTPRLERARGGRLDQ